MFSIWFEDFVYSNLKKTEVHTTKIECKIGLIRSVVLQFILNWSDEKLCVLIQSIVCATWNVTKWREKKCTEPQQLENRSIKARCRMVELQNRNLVVCFSFVHNNNRFIEIKYFHFSNGVLSCLYHLWLIRNPRIIARESCTCYSKNIFQIKAQNEIERIFFSTCIKTVSPFLDQFGFICVCVSSCILLFLLLLLFQSVIVILVH